jgi:Fe-S cluster biogenesis protein NfuA
MFIQTEETPNPLTLKFIPGREVMEKGVAEFKTLEESTASPLAHRLMGIEGVSGIFYGSDFITVTREERVNWYVLKPHILGVMMEFYLSGQDLFKAGGLEPTGEGEGEGEEDPIVAQIRELLDLRIRPAVAMDGGDISFDRFEDGIVYLHLKGSCAGCPSATATLKAGIESTLRHYVPEVLEVRAV